MADIYVNDINYHILNTDARVIVNYGGRDSGKSYFTGGQYIPISMLQEDHFRGVTVRKTYTSNKDSTYKEILDGIEDMDQDGAFSAIKSPLEITCNSNNNKMIFRGLDKPRKLKSLKGINFIWVEEAEDLSETEFDDLMILLRGKGYQRIVLTYNPMDSEHFTNNRFVDTTKDNILETFEDGDPKVWEKFITQEVDGEEITYKVLVVRSTYKDNDFIDPIRKAVIEKLKETNPFLYKIYAKAEYAQKGGKILTNTELVDFEQMDWKFNNFDNKGYAQDFGFNHANAILPVAEKDNCLYVFNEIYVHEKDPTEIMELARKNKIRKNLLMICDSAEPGTIKQWKTAGWRAKGVKKFQGSVKHQIDLLKGYDKIYINTKCENTWKESKSYVWKQDKNGNYTDDPVTVFDDAMAALRYSTDLFSRNGKWGW